MKNFYITTPIYYVNDKPHIGHAYTTIACDILARYNKLLENNVFFVTGTDEHGQKVEKAAINKQKELSIFVNEMSDNFEKLIPFLGCNINDFVRTTEKRHIKAAQFLWNKLKENDHIYLSNYEGWYSVRDECFYTESELIKKDDSFIAPTGASVEWVKEESYFFRLSGWQNKLIKFYENNKDSIKPVARYNEVLSFIKGGLRDLSISRTTFRWGVPVPNDNKHVMYVWIDALCNYLTVLGYPFDENEINKSFFWPGTHIVGKDILRFHAVYWPAFLMSSDLKPPNKIFAHGWWTNEGQKISKSLGNAIDPYDIITQFGLDQIRYFLFREVPFGNDGDFSRSAIALRVNADLSNNYGNLVQRVASFIVKNCNSKLSCKNIYFNDVDNKLILFFEIKLKVYFEQMNLFHIDKALKNIFELLTETNIYIDSQAPWSLKKSDINRMNIVLFLICNIIIKTTIMLLPIIPGSANRVLEIFNVEKTTINFQNFKDFFSSDIVITDPKPIFPRIE